MGACVLKPVPTFLFWWRFVWATLNAPLYHQRGRLLNCVNNRLDGSSTLWYEEHGVLGFQKEFHNRYYLTSEQFSTLTQSILTELYPKEDNRMTRWMHVWLFLCIFIRPLSSTGVRHGEMCLLTMIYECFWAVVLMQCHPRAQRPQETTGIQYLLPALTLELRDVLRFFKYFINF